MRRRLISTIRERRPENVARRTLTKCAPCSTYSTYSASSAAFVFCAAAKGSAATLHNTALHYTTLSTYFTLYSFLGFIPLFGRCAWRLRPRPRPRPCWVRVLSVEAAACLEFALLYASLSALTPRPSLSHSDPPRAASFSLLFLCFSPPLPLFFWM